MTVVRRCARCGEPAAVARQSYEGAVSVLGFSTRTGAVAREDFVCQRCGAGFVLEAPRKRLFVALIFGMPTLGLGPCLGSLGLLSLVQRDPAWWIVALIGLALSAIGAAVAWWAYQPARMWRIHPVVPGAPVPAFVIDVPRAPPRRCTCGAAAHVVGITQHESRGVSQGRTTRYACAACKREFGIEDLRGTVLFAVGGAVFTAIGVALATTAGGQGAFAWVCSGLVALLGLAGFALTAFAIAARVRHPVTR